MSLKEEKAALRLTIRQALRAMSPEARQSSDELLLLRLRARPEFQAAGSLFLFYGVGTEPDTRSLILSLLEEGRPVALPRVLPGRRMEFRRLTDLSQLRPGPLHTMEPDESCPVIFPKTQDFTLVPALCYDESRYRLGQGGGYYDRFLADLSGFSAGLCRDAVLQRALPVEPHDRPVRLILTETRAF
ncbi:MAG: 5-formyltetrahydrofolate cyclo-ligase [Oscillospiraceae bacterium]|nr:5-formyltetrahydrofolate cyclo-ligase [Oscillospiraceae bacterium]